MNTTSGATPDVRADFGPQAPPDDLFSRPEIGEPFRDPIGRRAWTKPDAPRAARILGENGYAILRVEVWCLCWEDTYSAVIPYLDQAYGRFDWRQEEAWSPERETWPRFCARCAEWAASKIALADYEPHLTPEYPAEKMRFYFLAVSRDEYDGG
jgi:hypothetical protein